MEPLGAKFALPLPFLWQHEGKEAAIGHVVAATPSKDGIPVKIQLATDDVPGLLKDRLDYAWRSIKKGLVPGLSIGFRELDSEPIKGSFGARIKSWEWLELSAVTIPANQDATILAIKSHDIPMIQPRHNLRHDRAGEPDTGRPVLFDANVRRGMRLARRRCRVLA